MTKDEFRKKMDNWGNRFAELNQQLRSMADELDTFIDDSEYQDNKMSYNMLQSANDELCKGIANLISIEFMKCMKRAQDSYKDT